MTEWPNSQSPVRVQVSDNIIVDGIAVRISLHYSPQEIKVGKVNERGYLQFEPYDTTTYTDPGVTFSFNNDIARGLLEALLRYYNGSEDARTTRADLLHERERVDKLVGVVCEIAHDAMVSVIEER